ncbi:uncharacterized protein LOC142354229 [Convolutriloba macropyga]|uniref:uncharacterized protein LOC142354229 n=1 Tax=Convolutriloba macropyga TaxID=536237 RepID=UPI003F524F77
MTFLRPPPKRQKRKKFYAVTSGKIYSKSGQYSINFDDPTGAKIYDEVGGFVANEGGLFPVGGFGMVDDNMIFMINATAGKNGGQGDAVQLVTGKSLFLTDDGRLTIYSVECPDDFETAEPVWTTRAPYIGFCDSPTNPLIKGKLYRGYYEDRKTSIGVSPGTATDSDCTDSILSHSWHYDGWSRVDASSTCNPLEARYGMTDFREHNDGRTCIFETPCIYGYLFESAIQPSGTFIENKANLFECIELAVANQNTSIYGVTAKTNSLSGGVDCYYFYGEPDINVQVVNKDLTGDTCFLKGRNFCPERGNKIQVQKLPGVWAWGLHPVYSYGGYQDAPQGKRCAEVSYQQGSWAQGFLAINMLASDYYCDAHNRSRGQLEAQASISEV